VAVANGFAGKPDDGFSLASFPEAMLRMVPHLSFCHAMNNLKAVKIPTRRGL
jgi:hypothetical protein